MLLSRRGPQGGAALPRMRRRGPAPSPLKFLRSQQGHQREEDTHLSRFLPAPDRLFPQSAGPSSLAPGPGGAAPPRPAGLRGARSEAGRGLPVGPDVPTPPPRSHTPRFWLFRLRPVSRLPRTLRRLPLRVTGLSPPPPCPPHLSLKVPVCLTGGPLPSHPLVNQLCKELPGLG